MAVNPQASLTQVRAKVGLSRLQQRNAVAVKFAAGSIPRVSGPSVGLRGGANGGAFPISSVPTPIFSPFPPPSVPVIPSSPFQPSIPNLPTQPRQPGLGEVGCNLLPEGFARQACLLALSAFGGTGGQTGFTADDCPPGMVKLGDNCIDLTALPPGGDPAVIAMNGNATVGAFGLPALTPQGVSRVVRKCGRGMVLGVDNLCYPKAVLTGRSKFRKWKRPVRPPVSRKDVVAIRRAAGARDRVLDLAKDVGLSVSKTKRKAAAAKKKC